MGPCRSFRIVHIPAVVSIAALLVQPGLSFAQRGGLEVFPIRDAKGQQVGLYSESHALVIGVSRYTNGWPRLAGFPQVSPSHAAHRRNSRSFPRGQSAPINLATI
jgi:hypothetical protein